MIKLMQVIIRTVCIAQCQWMVRACGACFSVGGWGWGVSCSGMQLRCNSVWEIPGGLFLQKICSFRRVRKVSRELQTTGLIVDRNVVSYQVCKPCASQTRKTSEGLLDEVNSRSQMLFQERNKPYRRLPVSTEQENTS